MHQGSIRNGSAALLGYLQAGAGSGWSGLREARPEVARPEVVEEPGLGIGRSDKAERDRPALLALHRLDGHVAHGVVRTRPGGDVDDRLDIDAHQLLPVVAPLLSIIEVDDPGHLSEADAVLLDSPDTPVHGPESLEAVGRGETREARVIPGRVEGPEGLDPGQDDGFEVSAREPAAASAFGP